MRKARSPWEKVYVGFPGQHYLVFFFFQAEDGIRDSSVTGVQTCALPIYSSVVIIPKVPHASTSAQSKISLDDSTARRTAWARGTFVNTKPSCFRSGSYHRAPLRTACRPCVFSTPRRSRRAGASPTLLIRKEHFTSHRS